MSWPAYPALKPSGVEWLGQVPSHWNVDRIKWSVLSSQNGIWGAEPDGGPDDIRCVRVADFDRPRLSVQDRDVTYRSVSGSERRGRILSKGDLILEKSGGGENNPVGFVVLYDRDDVAVTSNFVARVTLRPGMEPRFWTYLHSWLYNSGLTRRSLKQTSGIQNLDQQSYFDERVCFPPPTEQVVIADFLDEETDKIDALIGKQEQLIATLREDRTATISHAVTKGINQQVEMKDSGVDWLGPVPAHWAVVALKYGLCEPITDGPHETPEFLDDGVEFISAEAVSTGVIDFERRRGFISREDHVRYSRKYSPQLHDIYVVKSGATTGVSAILTDIREFNIWSPLAVLRCGDQVDPYFLLNFIRSRNFQDAIALNWSYGTQQNIGMGVLGNLRIALPQILEQREIVRHIESLGAPVAELIVKASDAIKSLYEYRSALITDAVTGKIDVRGAA